MNKHFKRLAVFAMSAMAAIPSATTVFAEDATKTVDNTTATIDHSKTGSITLYKFMDNDGKTVSGEGIPYGTTGEEVVNAIKEKVGDNAMPEKGVKFKIMKVADIEQVTQESTDNDKTGGTVNTTGVYYTNIDSGFFDLFEKYSDGLVAATSTRHKDGRDGNDPSSNIDDHYESDELNEKMMALIRQTGSASKVTGEVAVNRYVRSKAADNQTCWEMSPTDEYGMTTVEKLPLGLYLISEVDYEHSSLSKFDNYWEVVDDKQNDVVTSHAKPSEVPVNEGTQDADTSRGSDNGGSMAAGTAAGGSTYADIASPSSPFLISVPMTNIATVNGHAPGTVWQYDIFAYPKNQSIGIHKDIVTNDGNKTGTENNVLANDGHDTIYTETMCDYKQSNYLPDGTKMDTGSFLTHQIDANIGDIVTQVVSSNVPRLTDDIDDESNIDDPASSTNDPRSNRDNQTRKHNAKYVITDRMTKGLNLIDHSSFKVTLGQGAWNDGANKLLVEGTDYTLDIAADRMSFVLTLTSEGLKKMDDIPSASYLYVKYDTVLTKDALIGTDTYGNQRTVVKSPVDIQKENDNTGTKSQAGVSEDQSNNNTNNTGTTEKQAQDISDSTTTKSQDYTSTYSQGATDKDTAEVKHLDATNQNTAQLTYATDRTEEHDYYSNTTKVFTYELDLTKTFTNGTKGFISKNKTGGEAGNNTEFDYTKVKFAIRGAVRGTSLDGYEKAAENTGKLTSHDANNAEAGLTAAGEATVSKAAEMGAGETDGNPVERTGEMDGSWEQMLFIKTGDGTYRVYDPHTDNNASFDDNADKTTLATTYADGKISGTANASVKSDSDVATAYEYTAPVGTVSKYLIPNSKTGLLTVAGLDSRTYELTEVATAPGRNLLSDKVYVELVANGSQAAKELPGGASDGYTKLENGSLKHAYVWTGSKTKPANYADNDIANYDKTKARLDMGRVPFTIQNNEVIKVLKTGGKGMWAYIAIGAGALMIGGFYTAKRKKEEDNNLKPIA